ncbi:MAG: electron transport complex subunit E [Calditrichaeota bacterium]|nr:electron transport complex subunit E [Calditrichota bacterium]RQV99274.1 MAG: electron transport complex subunit E [Calditrichota bacterium]
MSLITEAVKGIYKENPVFRLALGLCPVLAVSTSIINAIGMGAATTFVLLSSNTIVSLLILLFGKILSEEGQKSINKIRIPMFIVVIASFVTIVEMVMAAYFPELSESLGIFIPLIVVNCIILGRAEGFASKNPLLPSIADAIGMGIGFTLALTAIAFIRELLGSGALLGFNIMGGEFKPVLLFILPPGAFLVIGIYMGFLNWLDERKKRSS